ncbi:unnamed protein product [Amoebophrya sp. A25]|nr:unnamed protein product [Amoebophrya sp. A25]|eukprot:GSA25T00016527001.1
MSRPFPTEQEPSRNLVYTRRRGPRPPGRSAHVTIFMQPDQTHIDEVIPSSRGPCDLRHNKNHGNICCHIFKANDSHRRHEKVHISICRNQMKTPPQLRESPSCVCHKG